MRRNMRKPIIAMAAVLAFIGNGMAQSVGDFRSAQNGNWNSTATWQRYDNGAWGAAASTPSSTSGIITVQSNHVVTVSAAVTTDQVVVEAGGQMNVTSTLTLANGAGTDITVFGTLFLNGGTITVSSGANLAFEEGGVYRHNDGGNVRTIPTASWHADSTIVIERLKATNGLHQTFGNFHWNTVAAHGDDIDLPAFNVQRKYTHQAANSKVTRFNKTSSARTINIGGNFVILSGLLELTSDSGATTLNVAGDYNQSGGTFEVKVGGGAATLNVARNFSFTGGTLQRNNTSGSNVNINFNGSEPQIYTGGGTFAAGKNLINFTVNTGSILNAGTGLVANGSAGTFTLSSGATLHIGDPNGITTSGASGNIRNTGSRTYNTGAHFVYSGNTAQVPGNGLPTTISGSLTIENVAGVAENVSRTINGTLLVAGLYIPSAAVVVGGTGTLTGAGTVRVTRTTTVADFNSQYTIASKTLNDLTVDYAGIAAQTVNGLAYGNLVINNSAGVSLAGDATVNGVFTLSNGIVSTGGNTLTAGTVNGGSPASYVNGRLGLVFSDIGAKMFPIGKSGNYRPLTFAYTELDASSIVTAEQFESGFPGTVLTPLLSRYWTITQSGATDFVYNLTLDGTGIDSSETVRILKHDGGTTVSVNASAPNYTAVGLTSLSDFTLAGLDPTATQAGNASAVYGDSSVLLSASVSPEPVGGTVNFYVNDILAGNASVVGGAASVNFHPASLGAGNHIIKASFSGHGDLAPSSSHPLNNGTLTITPRQVTLTAENKSKTYGVADPTLTFTVGGNGLRAGDSINEVFTGTLQRSSGESVLGSPYAITQGTLVPNGNYEITSFVPAELEIALKTLSLPGVTIGTKVYDATTGATVTSFGELDGIVDSDDVEVDSNSAQADFAMTSPGTHQVTISGLALTGSDAGNYVIQNQTSTGTVTAKELTLLGLTAENKTYNANITASVASFGSLSGVLDGETVTLNSSASVAHFESASAGTGKTVSVSNLSLEGEHAANYSLDVQTTTADITALTVTVTGITAENKVYDGTSSATLNIENAGLERIISGDEVTLNTSGVLGAFDNKNVGVSKTVTISGLFLEGAEAENYSLVQPPTSGSIAAIDLTVTGITAADKEYDATQNATLDLANAELAGIRDGDDVQLNTLGAVGHFADKSVGTGKRVFVAGLTIHGTDAGNYALTGQTATASILVKTVAISGVLAESKVYDGTTEATLDWSDTIIAGIELGDDVALATDSANGSFADKNVGNAKVVTVSGIALNGTDSTNYTIEASPTSSANITARALMVTATGENKIYDGNASAAVSLSTDQLDGDDITAAYTSAVFGDKNAASDKSISVTGISLSGSDTGNYSFNTTASARASIVPRALAVGAVGQSKVYDGTSAATVTLSDDRISGDDLTAGHNAAAFEDKNVGIGKTIYVSGISISGSDAGNYTANTETTTNADIAARTLLISAVGQNKEYDGTAAAIVTLLTDKEEGDDVVASYSEAAFENKHVGTNKSVEVNGISITGDDSGNYTANTTATTSADINARTLAITATAENKVYDTTTTATVTLSADEIQGDDVAATHTTAAFADKNVGTGKTVNVSGVSISGDDSSNYSFGTSTTTTADITAAALVVSATAQNKTYDGTTVAVVTLADDRLEGDEFTLNHSSAEFSDKNVGQDKTVSVSGISLSGTDAGNYSLNSSAQTTADITAKALTGIADNKNRAYGTANPEFTVTYTGFVVGEDETIVIGSLGSSTTATLDSSIGIYPISVSGQSAPNYAITYLEGTLTITAYALTVTADDANRTYGASNPEFTGSILGIQNNDNITAGYSTSASENSGIGTYNIVPTLNDPDGKLINYSVTANNGTLTVTAADLVVVVDHKTIALNTDVPELTGSVNGIQNDDDITVTYSTIAPNGSSAGTYPIIATLDDNGSGVLANYFQQISNGVLTIIAPVMIDTSFPGSITKEEGESLDLAVQVSGGGTLHYQWFFASQPIEGATTSHFSIGQVRPSDAGNYSVIVSNEVGAATAGTILAVKPDPIAPKVVVVTPKNNVVYTNTSLEFTGTASDATRVQGVQYNLNGAGFVSANLSSIAIKKLTNWLAVATLLPGTNSVIVKSFDLAGNETVVGPIIFFYHTASPLLIQTTLNGEVITTNGVGTVINANKLFDGNPTNLFIGRSYQLKAVETGAPKYVLTNWTATWTGQTTPVVLPAASLLNFEMKPNMVVHANFIENPFNTLGGTYTGLFSDGENGVNYKSAGLVTLKITPKRGFSAKILVDGNSVGVSGKMALDGTGTAVSKSRFKTTDKPELTIHLALDIAGNSQTLSGSISENGGGWSSSLLAHRVTWATNNLASIYANNYTMIIPGYTNNDVGPVGSSYGLLNIDRLGKLRTAGFMADGHALKQATWVSKDGQWPLFCRLYKEKRANAIGKTITETKGFLMGWIEFRDANGTGNLAPAGEVHWVKLGWTNAYASGLTNTIDIEGSRWKLDPEQVGVQSALTNINRAQLEFSGDIETGFAATYNVSDKTTFTEIKNDSAYTYPNEVKASLVAKRGVFKGTFVHPDSGNATKYFGAMLQDLHHGEGSFIGNNLKGGLVTVEAESSESEQ